jgi:hypothetical protein
MTVKVSDLTVEELEERIRHAVREVLHEEDTLSDDFAEELEARLANPVWLKHEDVWKER